MIQTMAAHFGTFQAGDRILFSFCASEGKWRRAAQAAIIEWRLDRHPDEFYVRRVDYSGKVNLDFTIEVVAEPKHLYSEKEIVDMILNYNPMGFALVFVESVKSVAAEVWEKVKEPALVSAWLLTAVIVLVVFYKTRKS